MTQTFAAYTLQSGSEAAGLDLGGRVWATSEGIGLGGEFVVELPLAADGHLRAAAANSADAAGQPLPRASGERVLIVDDNHDAAVLLHEALEGLGYEVRTAADGPTALTIAAEFAPAIGVLDLGLPVMDGYELARNLQGRHDIRLVAVTGYGQRSDHERSRAAGFVAHLVKPIAIGELAETLDRLRRASAPGAP